MNSERQKILEAVVQSGLDKALSRHVSPSILGSLLSLGWSEQLLGQCLGLTGARICQMVQGHTAIPPKHAVRLYALLDATLKQYDQEIERLKQRDEWSLAAQHWMRYKLSTGRSTLTRWRRRKQARSPRKAA